MPLICSIKEKEGLIYIPHLLLVFKGDIVQVNNRTACIINFNAFMDVYNQPTTRIQLFGEK